MLRKLWVVVLALGVVLGFGSGFAHLCGYGPYGHYGHGFYGHGFGDHGRFEDRAADACVRAAERVLAERHAPATVAPAPAPAAPAP